MLRNGTKPRRVAAGSGRDESSPAWSPDGTSIVYQDCSAGASTECGVRTVVPGSPPFDVSTLRAPWVDTFDGGDSRFWQVISNGKGATNTEQNGQLVTTLAADSVEGGQYNEIETHWGTQCRLVGDFDVQADYRLLEWPQANSVQAALSSFAGPSNIGFMIATAIGPKNTLRESGSIASTAASAVSTIGRKRRTVASMIAWCAPCRWRTSARRPGRRRHRPRPSRRDGCRGRSA